MTEKQTEAHSMTMTDRQSSNTDILTEIDRQRDIDWLSVGRSDLYIHSTHLQRLYNLIRNHMTQFDKLFNSLHYTKILVSYTIFPPPPNYQSFYLQPGLYPCYVGEEGSD